MKLILLALACAAHSAATVPQRARDAAPRRLDSADLWVTAGEGTYDEMQANCSAAGGHLVVPASEAEREAALAAVQASDHGDVEIWIGYELPSGSDPGTMANYDGENGLTMEEVGYYLWDSNCGKCGTSKSWDRCVHHTTVATGGGTPGYYMATCSGPRPGVCQGMNSIATSSFNLKGISMDDNRIRTAVTAWLADATVAEATYGHISTWKTGEVTDMEELFHRASSFNEDIGAWNTSGVTTMEDMFGGAYAFDQPIGNWSVGAVTNMNRVFEGASAFNQDIGHWPVDSVIDMKKMFSEASAFNQDLSDWRLDSVTDCVEINQCVGCTRQFFTKSFLGDDAAVLARSSGEEPASPRHRAGVASMAWRSTRRFSTNAP